MENPSVASNLIVVVVHPDLPVRTAVERSVASDPGITVLESSASLSRVAGIVGEPFVLVTGIAHARASWEEFRVRHEEHSGISPPLVLIGEQGEDAVDAFDLGATDLVLRPVEADRVQMALHRAGDALQQRLAAPNRRSRRLTRAASGGVAISIPPSRIEFVEAERNYCLIHDGGVGEKVRMTITAAERLLAPHGHVRVHRSYLVNPSAVVEQRPGAGGAGLLFMRSGAVVPRGAVFRNRLRA